ncbi:20S-pre-rRNA D-site endonuclease nob1 [Neophaeococcomyces mojaviensis]|uniref:20S-pre-rRNA D-site endonuclease nob1 n=1 Tax=Neophaeococcomyces mojaviensis TaxID=3383035 RepID=A0ACC3A359_9EURO|nr:20S-pre-rRNA D-site endonuclease nob1 [Knufia sp. JES_112]
MAQGTQNKSIHTILLDASPILLNTPSISTLTATCTSLVTTPAVVSEIRGEEARTRFETLYKPFVEIRSPKPESVKFARDFARRTGDLAVLSATDIEVLALAYDLECERNGGDWRLRSVPGQKRVNGRPPDRNCEGNAAEEEKDHLSAMENLVEGVTQDLQSTSITPDEAVQTDTQATEASNSPTAEDVMESTPVAGEVEVESAAVGAIDEEKEGGEESEDSDGGWITPSNLKRRQAQDEAGAATSQDVTKTLQVATMTGDFAMQNVLLQMNLNLLSTKTCKRIAHIKQTIFRCHACFQITKDMSKQFCPRCGKPSLTRVTCTTNDKGEVKLHLKQNYQWNNRGNVFSVPKPTSGAANQKWKGPQSGGGQGGWGRDLILAEDQKEYIRAVSSTKRTKPKDLMDEDSLPSIFTGDRSQHRGRIQVGAGRNVNSRKR